MNAMVGAVGEGGDANIAKGNANALAVAGLVLGLGLVLAFGLRYQDFGAGVGFVAVSIVFDQKSRACPNKFA